MVLLLTWGGPWILTADKQEASKVSPAPEIHREEDPVTTSFMCNVFWQPFLLGRKKPLMEWPGGSHKLREKDSLPAAPSPGPPSPSPCTGSSLACMAESRLPPPFSAFPSSNEKEKYTRNVLNEYVSGGGGMSFSDAWIFACFLSL
jgi:hypothetical protein